MISLFTRIIICFNEMSYVYILILFYDLYFFCRFLQVLMLMMIMMWSQILQAMQMTMFELDILFNQSLTFIHILRQFKFVLYFLLEIVM